MIFPSVEPDCISLLIGSSDSLGGQWMLSSPAALSCIVVFSISEDFDDILTINSKVALLYGFNAVFEFSSLVSAGSASLAATVCSQHFPPFLFHLIKSYQESHHRANFSIKVVCSVGWKVPGV